MSRLPVLEQRFSVSSSELWPKLVSALETIPGATLIAADEERLEARFITGVTTTSWGQNMAAKVTPTESGGSLLQVAGQIKHTFFSSAWGERIHQKTVSKRLLKALQEKN